MTTLKEIAFNRQLATEVKRHMCVYDSVAKHDKGEIDDAWREIMRSLNEPNINVDECKRKWSNLRNHYYKAKKAGEIHYLDAEMSFLLPHLKLNLRRANAPVNKNTLVNPLTNILLHSILSVNQSQEANAGPGNNPQSGQNTEGASSQVVDHVRGEPGTTEEGEGFPRRKRRVKDISDWTKHSEPEDERVVFLQNLSPVLQAMNEEQWKKFRSRVTTIVDEILE